jgi:hypothetical protein
MEVSDREKRSLPPRACSDCYSLNPHLKTVPLNSDLAPSHFVYGRALHRARQTVINRVQSSQIKIACRSTYIHGAILSVDEWQHSVAVLVRTSAGHTRCRSIQAAHFTYFLLMLKEKSDQFPITIRANTPLKTTTCWPGRLVIHRYVFLY